MLKKVLLTVALLALLPFTATAPGNAAEPPIDQGMTSAPDDPEGVPDPPDGVSDPDANYPIDGAEGTDQGEPGADAPPAAAAGSDARD